MTVEIREMTGLGLYERVTQIGQWWWRIEAKADHYAAVVSGMVIGTVEKNREGTWGWHPISGMGHRDYTSLNDALQQARQAAESHCEDVKC